MIPLRRGQASNQDPQYDRRGKAFHALSRNFSSDLDLESIDSHEADKCIDENHCPSSAQNPTWDEIYRMAEWRPREMNDRMTKAYNRLREMVPGYLRRLGRGL